MRLTFACSLAALALAAQASAQTRPAPNVGRINQPPAYNNTLQVRIFGVQTRLGKIVVQLCDATIYPRGCDLFQPRDEFHHLVAIVDQPSKPETTVNIGVPQPGRFVVEVWHDVNGNRTFERGDGRGFSRGAVGGARDQARPSFDAAAIDVTTAPTQTDVTLRYDPR